MSTHHARTHNQPPSRRLRRGPSTRPTVPEGLLGFIDEKDQMLETKAVYDDAGKAESDDA